MEEDAEISSEKKNKRLVLTCLAPCHVEEGKRSFHNIFRNKLARDAHMHNIPMPYNTSLQQEDKTTIR